MAIAVAVQAAPAPMRVSQRGGEVAESPLGRTRLVSRPPANADLEWPDPRSMASIWLEQPGRAARLLARYGRDGEVRWSRDGRFLIFRSIDAHMQRLHVFAAAVPLSALQGIQRRIETAMRAKRPRLGSIENRSFQLRRFDGAGFCVRVEESGLPPGRELGSFLSRSGAFRIRYTGRVAPVSAC